MTDAIQSSDGQVTALLRRASRGDAEARNELYPHIYQEMRRLAAAYMARERAGHTLQPTALLHEAYLRLIEAREVDWVGRGHFYATAAKIMRPRPMRSFFVWVFIVDVPCCSARRQSRARHSKRPPPARRQDQEPMFCR